MANASENSDLHYMDRHQKVGALAVARGGQVLERDYGAVAPLSYTKPTGGGSLASSVTRNDITWTFDGLYEVGQYVTGDWWVLGPATVVSVSPAPLNGNNGSMVNPQSTINCAYDSQIPYYDASLGASYPVTLQPEQSLVSTRSQDGNVTDLCGFNVSDSFQHLRSAEVLTCVSTAPLPTEFRPPLVGSVKPRFDSATMQTGLLPSLALTGGAFVAPDATTATDYARYFERPWILHVRDWVGRQSHPTENMPNYHREVYNVISDASLILVSNLSLAQKYDLLIGFVQCGIDMYYATITGPQGADSSCNKWVVMFAGYMLNNSAMIATSYNYRTEWMSYYAANGTSPFVSGIVPADQGWTGATVLWRQDPGQAEHEHLHPTEWQQAQASPTDNGAKREVYRRSNSYTWPGFCLAAISMSAQADWGHPEFFEYVDRWMTEDDVDAFSYIESLWSTQLYIGGGATGSTFSGNMWDAHRGSYA